MGDTALPGPQLYSTLMGDSGLRMKIAIPRLEPTTGPIPKRRGRPKKTLAVGTSTGTDSSDDAQRTPNRARPPARQLSGSGGRARNSVKAQRSASSSSSSSSSDFGSFSGTNGKRSVGRPKIRPTAASTPAASAISTHTTTTSLPPNATPIKRRPGRPPKKIVCSPAVDKPPRIISEVRLSLADGGSSSDNDAAQAISAAINRAFESGGSDSELNVNPGVFAGDGPASHAKTLAAGSSSGGGGGFRGEKKSSTTAAKAVLSPIQYTSSLLRDYVEKTQKLGQQQEANVIVPDQTANSLPRESSATNCEVPASGNSVDGGGGSVTAVRRKRGRPPKKPPVAVNEASVAAAGAQNKTDRMNSRLKLSMRDSPDSGILSVNQSPSQSPRTVKKPTASSGRSQSALLSLEKPIYPTERVLYPPRNIKRGRPPANKAKEERSQSTVYHDSAAGSSRTEKAPGVDPMWRKIDINKKFQPPTNGYKSDGGGAETFSGLGAGSSAVGSRGGEGSSAVCSKVLAAQCGYASDYGSVRKSRQSGYRSDYSTKSRKSGYRSDYSVKGGGGCGYRSDCSVRRKLRRKRRPKSSFSGCGAAGGIGGGDARGSDTLYGGLTGGSSYPKPLTTFDERDILQLAGLSLGNSSDDDSGNDVVAVDPKNDRAKERPGNRNAKKGAKKELICPLRRPIERFAATSVQFLDFDRAKFEREFIMNYRTLVAESRQETEAMEAKINEEAKARLKKVDKKSEAPKYNCFESFSNVLPILELKSKRSAKSIRSRRSSAVSRCSSRSNRSMHHKHRRKRLKSKSECGPVNKLAEKIRLQLEQIVEIFGKACDLVVEEPTVKAQQKPPVQRPVTPCPVVAVSGSGALVASKENQKETPKTAQKRALKKRKASENAEHTSTPSVSKRRTKKGQVETQSPDDHKLPLKKRHYLLTDGEKAAKEEEEGVKDSEPGEVAATEVKAPPATPKAKPAAESKVSVPSPLPTTPAAEPVPMTPRGGRKGAEQQPQQQPQESKKKKLPSPSTSAPRGRPAKQSSTVSLPSKLLSPVPPPGVFEPTMDLELQIPISTIVISGTGKGGSGLLTVRTKVEKCMDSPSLKKKRKKINRTGFPTVKKKKKRQTPIPNVVTTTTTMPDGDIMPDLKLEKCDRVPTDGEATLKFLERNDLKQRLAVVSLERLQECPPDVIVTRASRSKDSPVPPKSGSRDVSKDSLVASTPTPPPPTSLPRAAKKVKLEEPVQEEKEKVLPPTPPSESKKNKRRSVPLKVELPAPKVRGRRATSVERSDTVDTSNSLLDEISPLKRQSIRNLAKSLMVSETKDDVIEPPVVVAKKIDPRKRRMTVAVLETSKVRALPPPPPVPIKEESPTAVRDIKPAPATSELEQDALPVNEEEEEEIARTDTPSSEISDRSTSKRAPKWKKRYLPAGLFSEYYKEADKDRTNKTIVKDTDIPATTPELLPPPPYCEKFFRQSIVDFQLPHDLWYAHENQKLPGRDTIASWTFKKIRTNVYLDGKPNPKTDLPSCNCKHSSGCVDDCLNRMVYTECNPDTCPCEDKCQNTKIQRHEFAPGIERFMTEKKGWGVRTKQAIRKSQFIIEYLGEVVTEREFKERMGTVYAKDTHHYCLHLDGDLVIDGHRMGSDCRFVNHSCTPNCEVQKWNVNGLSRMCLFALRDIKPGEELTYDYNFALYNPSEGQPCKCDSKDCRGVIGGKSQRITKPPVEQKAGSAEDTKGVTSAARNRKRQAKKKHQSQQMNKVRPTTPLFQVPTCKEITIIRESHCFMIRNLMKVRKQKDVMPLMQSAASSDGGASSGGSAARRTRAIKSSEETDENVVQLRLAFLRITSELMEMKKEANDLLMTLPPKKKNPKYYERFERPIDLTTIHGNADKWVYSTVHSFDEDMLRMLRNALEFFDIKSEEHAAAEELKKAYEAKKWAEYQTLSLVVTSKELLRPFEPPATNELELKVEPNEDIIRCICGLFKDEGLMIECAKCQVWQHAECTRADLEVENYLCERCEPRDVDLEITIDEYSDEGYQYYLSLMRGSLQIRQTDTVYVLRDIPMTPDKSDPEKKVRKHTYETIGRIDYGDCDIFRVERLWKDKDGKRFVFGHHYLRPHETYHEPSRKFYPNEVVRVPLYEVVPIELIIDRCWVLDTTSYCKGRPVDSVEEHVYICELRVDKGARLFSKISKQANPVCIKSYAFKKFKQKLKISKSYAPHDHAPAGKGSSTPIPSASTTSAAAASLKKEKKRKQDVPIASRKNSTSIVQLRPPPPKTLQEKRQRLDATLTRLMAVHRASNPGAPEMDLSYLLTGRGARTKSSRAISNAVVTSIT